MKRIFFASLLFRGILTIIAQVLLIRELLITFLGNELSIGIILANWLILEALGSSIFGRIASRIKRKILTFVILMIIISLYLPVAVYLARTIKTILGIGIGEVAGIPIIFISSLTILSVLSFCDGALFSLGCSIYSSLTKRDFSSIAFVYILESLGFFVGGLFFSFLLIRYFDSFQIILLVSIINLILGLILITKDRILETGRPHKTFILIILLIIAAFGFLFLNSQYLGQISLNSQWKGLNILDYKNSVYGNIMVTKRLNEFTFFYDGIPVLTNPNPDTASIEDLAHFSLLSHPRPQRVLVIGAAAGGLINEILKHPVRVIDYAELDPLIIKMIKKFPTAVTAQELSSPRVRLHYIDGRLFVKKNIKNYDIIIVNLPSPSNLQLNRFYTLEFFKETKKALQNDGLLVLRLPGSLAYLRKEMKQLNYSVYQTLNQIFKDTRVIPGDTNLYLASGEGLGDFGPDTIIQRLKRRGINSRNISEFYIKDRLDSRWRDWFLSQLRSVKQTKINRDLQSSALFYEINYLNAQFSPRLNYFFNWLERLKFRFVIIILILLNLAAVLFKRRLKSKIFAFNFAILSTGFMGMGINLILILAFQSFYGYLYYQITFLISSFMIGLAWGSLFMTRRLKNSSNDLRDIIKVELGIIVFCITVGLILLMLNRFLTVEAIFEKFKSLFPVLCILCGGLVGLEFPLVNKIRLTPLEKTNGVREYSLTGLTDKTRLSRVGGSVYAWDLLGSWVSALSVSIVLIPLFGIIQTIVLVVLLKITSLNLIFNI